jgi:hypothetical protein
MISVKRVAAALIVSLATGCSSNGDSQPSDVVRAAEEKQAAWEAQQIVSYTFRYRHSCFCPLMDAYIDVVDGVVSGGRDADTGEDLDPLRLSLARTVDEMFQFIFDKAEQDVETLTVEYDDVLSYPTKITVDHDSQIADDEIVLFGTELTESP